MFVRSIIFISQGQSKTKTKQGGGRAKTTTKKFLSANTCFLVLQHPKNKTFLFPCVLCTTRPWRGDEVQKRSERVCGVALFVRGEREVGACPLDTCLWKNIKEGKKEGKWRRVSVGKGALASSRTKCKKNKKPGVLGLGSIRKGEEGGQRSQGSQNISSK